MRICGRKDATLPTPPMMPSTSMAFTGPSGRRLPIVSPIHPKKESSQSCGYEPSQKVAMNMMASMRMNMGKPT